MDLFIRKLQNFTALSAAEIETLKSVPYTTRDIPADTDLTSEGERPATCRLILEGFCCRYQLLADGRRQIMSFHIPGDLCDLTTLFLGPLDHSLGTLVATKVGFVPHEAINDIVDTYPRINRALWRHSLVDSAIFRQWVVNIGQRSAYERAAHLLCEVYSRFEAVGLAAPHSYELPVTQAELADALGLSTVHVNRTLQELRGDGLITLRGRFVTIHDWESLKRAGDFNANYLHQLAAA